MIDPKLIFALFYLSLGSIIVGVIIGFRMGQQHILRGHDPAVQAELQRRAKARIERKQVTVADPEPAVAVSTNILDAEVID